MGAFLDQAASASWSNSGKVAAKAYLTEFTGYSSANRWDGGKLVDLERGSGDVLVEAHGKGGRCGSAKGLGYGFLELELKGGISAELLLYTFDEIEQGQPPAAGLSEERDENPDGIRRWVALLEREVMGSLPGATGFDLKPCVRDGKVKPVIRSTSPRLDSDCGRLGGVDDEKLSEEADYGSSRWTGEFLEEVDQPLDRVCDLRQAWVGSDNMEKGLANADEVALQDAVACRACNCRQGLGCRLVAYNGNIAEDRKTDLYGGKANWRLVRPIIGAQEKGRGPGAI